MDSRLSSTRTYILAEGPTQALPLPDDGGYAWNLPTQTTTLRVVAVVSVPVTFDYLPDSGDPDLTATSSGDKAASMLSAVTPGSWFASPSEIVPTGTPPRAGRPPPSTWR